MDNTTDKDLITIRDLQEIKITLRTFSENSIAQLQLLREILADIVAQENTANKKVDEIDFLIKSFKKSIEENNKNIQMLGQTLSAIENKTIDRNNRDAIIISVEKLKGTTEDINVLMKTMSVCLSENKIGIREIENKINAITAELDKIAKNINKVKDVKKNLSWWVDWIYKILLTAGLIYGFLLK